MRFCWHRSSAGADGKGRPHHTRSRARAREPQSRSRNRRSCHCSNCRQGGARERRWNSRGKRRTLNPSLFCDVVNQGLRPSCFAIHPLLDDAKVAPIIRVPVRGRVIRIRVRETVGRASVPMAAKAERANDVGKHEVSVVRVIRAA